MFACALEFVRQRKCQQTAHALRMQLFGDIALRLRRRAPETEFDRGIKAFGAMIMKAVFQNAKDRATAPRSATPDAIDTGRFRPARP